jgi:hypothetical protein
MYTKNWPVTSSNNKGTTMENFIMCLEKQTREFIQTIQTNIQTYSYREERYQNPFSISLFYSTEKIDMDPQEFKKYLRKTDTFILLSDYIWCVVLDTISSQHHITTTENLYEKLVNKNNHKKIYAATVHSEEFDHDYLKMINTLFQRVEYGLKSHSDDHIITQDYIV